MEYTVSIDNKYLRKRKRKVLIHASESFNKSTQSTVVFINELHQLRMQFKSSLHVCVCVNSWGYLLTVLVLISDIYGFVVNIMNSI